MKILIAALVLASAFGLGAFAQVTFSGSAYFGVQLQVEDGDNEISMHHRDEGPPTFDFTASVVRDNFGARLNTIFTGTANPLTLNGIYGWVDFNNLASSNDSLRLSIGMLSSPQWVTGLHANVPEHRLDEVTGFRLDYRTPLQGLTVGVVFEAHDNLHDFGRQMIFGGTFIHPMFNMVFAYDLGSNGQTVFGFNFLGHPDLSAGIQLRANNLASWNNETMFYGELIMHQLLGYRITRALSAYVIFGQRIMRRDTANNSPDMGFEWEVNPGVEYRFLPNLTGILHMTFDNHRQNPLNLTINAGIEHILRGPAILYAEYELRLDNMDTVRHTVGFGITIRAF